MSAPGSKALESGRAPVNGIAMYYEIHGRGDGIPLVHRDRHRLWLLSADDSFVWGFFARGEMSIDQLTRHPFKNQLERSVGGMSPGVEEVLRKRIVRFPFAATDRVLLCSDGVWESFECQEAIHEVLSADDPDRALLDHLQRVGNRGRLHDNVSWLILSGGTADAAWTRLPRAEDDRLSIPEEPEVLA